MWPDTFVEENNLNQCISVLRRALGDRSEGTPRVETIPRRGYRFVGPVVERDDDATRPGPPLAPEADRPESGATPRRRVQRGMAVLAVLLLATVGFVLIVRWRSSPPPPIRSLAVLPFENLSGDAQQDYFADGFTETLITTLARIQSLRVVSRTSAMHYKGNRQMLSTGNLAANDRVALFLMDYPRRERLKILGHSRVEDARRHPELVAQFAEPEIHRVVERLFFIDVVSFDWNCPKYIAPRYTAAEVEAAVAPLRRRIVELENQLKEKS